MTQVVSDIDDTLMCSGGFWPAGRDTRYPKRCQYPGALTFYSELDIGYNSKIQVISHTSTCSMANNIESYTCAS